MTSITDALERLFENAISVIQDLGDEFTFQQFLREVAHDQQHAYIDLLYVSKNHERPFGHAHQHIGKRLRKIAEENGYEMSESSDNNELDFFGHETIKTVYRRKQ